MRVVLRRRQHHRPDSTDDKVVINIVERSNVDNYVSVSNVGVNKPDLLNDWLRVKLDSHVDTCCVGNELSIVNETQNTVKVTPFLKSLGSVSRVPIATAAIEYDDPRTRKMYVLVMQQGLKFEGMDHCLICPMQLGLVDVAINE
jgi:hypothetical protein